MFEITISTPSTTERTAQVCRAATRFCALRGWAPVQEMPLPNGRRADILALLPDGGFVVVEVKSGARDFLTDAKWPSAVKWKPLVFPKQKRTRH